MKVIKLANNFNRKIRINAFTEQLDDASFDSLIKLVNSPYSVEQMLLDNHEFGERLTEQVVQINDESFKFYYLPIETTIRQILANQTAMEYIMADHKGNTQCLLSFSTKLTIFNS